MMKKISIIVPIYRVPLDLLRACLKSLTSDSNDEIEIILIDDGSPDNCGEICDEFADSYRFCKVIHVENNGVSTARNIGLQVAIGNWVMFVDGDDRVPYGFINSIISFIDRIDDSVDIVQYEHIYINPDGQKALPYKENKQVTLAKPIEIANAILRGVPAERLLGVNNVLYGTPWGRLYKKSFLLKNNLMFPKGIKKRQDAIFCVAVMSKEPTQIFYPKIGYEYVVNDLSTTKKYNEKAFDIMWDAFDAMRTTVDQYYDGDKLDILNRALSTMAFSFLRDALSIGLMHEDCPMSLKEARDYFDQEYSTRWKDAVHGCDGIGVPIQARFGLFLLEHNLSRQYIALRQLKRAIMFWKATK